MAQNISKIMDQNKKQMNEINDCCNKGSEKKHTVNNATVKVEAPEPKQPRTDYDHCAVRELQQGDGKTVFHVTPQKKKWYAPNTCVFNAGNMTAFTRKTGEDHYVVSVSIHADSDEGREVELADLFLTALHSVFAHNASKKCDTKKKEEQR